MNGIQNESFKEKINPSVNSENKLLSKIKALKTSSPMLFYGIISGISTFLIIIIIVIIFVAIKNHSNKKVYSFTSINIKIKRQEKETLLNSNPIIPDNEVYLVYENKTFPRKYIEWCFGNGISPYKELKLYQLFPYHVTGIINGTNSTNEDIFLKRNILEKIGKHMKSKNGYDKVQMLEFDEITLNSFGSIISGKLKNGTYISNDEDFKYKIYFTNIKLCPILESITDSKYNNFYTNDNKINPNDFYKVVNNSKKFRNIFHDSFSRLDYIPVDSEGNKYEIYSLANSTSIGKNSFNNKAKYEYSDFASLNANFSIGVKEINYTDNNNKNQTTRVAFNEVLNSTRQKKIKYTNTSKTNYRITIRRGFTKQSDCKVAFRIIDIDNFYYAKIDEDYITLYLVAKNKQTQLYKSSTLNRNITQLLVNNNTLYIFEDEFIINRLNITEYENSTLCGLLFYSDTLSEVDVFYIDYIDNFIGLDIDSPIENDEMTKSGIAFHIHAESGCITSSTEKRKSSKRSMRVYLEYFKDYESHIVANGRRSEIVPHAKIAGELDSFMFKFDLFLAGKKDKKNHYAYDILTECFSQIHDSGGGAGLNPNFALDCQKDEIYVHMMDRELLIYDRSLLDKSRQRIVIAHLVESFNKSDNFFQIKKGEWHNFIVYYKGGYVNEHFPRLLVFIDGKKVLDYNHTNTYNSGGGAEYLKMGIYKSVWKTTNLTSNVTRKTLFFDNIYYLR